MPPTKQKKPPVKKEIADCKEPGCGNKVSFGCRGLCKYHYGIQQKAKQAVLKEKEKKSKARLKKAESFSKLRDKLDEIFSRFIRLRDTDNHGRGVCIDCGQVAEFNELDCGHFMSRTSLSTRWDEVNCAAQKTSCNRFQQGRQYEFGMGLDASYGKGTAESLLIKSKQPRKWSSDELKDLIVYYTQEVEKLLKTKAFHPWQKQ